MMKVKKDDIKKVLRAVGVSAAVVVCCIWYRNNKIAEKQKSEDDAWVKDFSEYTLKTASHEADTDTTNLSVLKNAYSFYSKEDLLKMLNVMNADSANYAEELKKDARIILNYRDQDFDNVLRDIKNKLVPYHHNVKPAAHEISNSLEHRFMNNYEQYKQNILVLKTVRRVLKGK